GHNLNHDNGYECAADYYIVTVSIRHNPCLVAEQFSRGVTALGAIGVSLSSFLLLLSQAPAIFDGAVIIQTWSWLPQLGIDFSFRLDSLALLFALLISGIGTLIYIYAYYYLNPKNSLSKLYFLLMLFM